MINLNSSELRRINLGGTGEMYLMEVEGREYLYKPAVRKYSDIKEPFRGIVQECAYEVQKMVDPESAVWCRYVDSGKFGGSVQERILVLANQPDYKRMQVFGVEFTQDQVNQFMREFVTDYLLCNFDGHGGNFITDVNGVIRGVDKEQSFRYLSRDESLVPDFNYHPNRNYGEVEPIYNTIFKRYINGELDIDFSVVEPFMARVESVDNTTYSTIFKPYCDACSDAFGSNSNAMLNKIVARKDNMRNVFNVFFNSLVETREMNVGKGNGQK